MKAMTSTPVVQVGCVPASHFTDAGHVGVRLPNAVTRNTKQARSNPVGNPVKTNVGFPEKVIVHPVPNAVVIVTVPVWLVSAVTTAVAVKALICPVMFPPDLGNAAFATVLTALTVVSIPSKSVLSFGPHVPVDA